MADGLRALNPLSYWTFSELSGTNAQNAMGGAAAVLRNGAAFNPGGVQGRGIRFDGVNDMATVAHASAYAANNGAISLWFQPDALGATAGLVSKNSTGLDTGGGFTLLLNADGTLTFQLESATAVHEIHTSATVSALAWSNVVVSWGAGGLQLWLNGALAASDTYTGGLGTTSGGVGANDPLVFGASTQAAVDRNTTGATNFFAGAMDEAAFFKTQPSAVDIAAIYQNGVMGANANPSAGVDAAGILENAAASVLGNVLANDTDSNGDTLTVFSVNGATANVGATVSGTLGTLVINANGSYSYALRPAANLDALQDGQTATDTFTYVASDGHGGLSSSTLVIAIVGENDAPLVTAETRPITEDPTTATLTGNVLTNDRDADGGVLQVEEVNGDDLNVGVAATSAYGAITIGANGVYSYVLNNASAAVQGLKVGQVVADTFSYTVSDGQGGSATTSITVSITGKNDTPVAVIDTNAVFAASPVAASGNVLANDTDVDGDTLTVNQVKGLATNVGVPVAGTYGTLTINANGSYTYMLNPASAALIALGPNQTATDTFAYRAGDGAANATSSLVITVTGQNEGPVVTAETRTITEDPTTATLTGNVLTNDRDPDGGVLAVQAVNGGPGNVGVAVTSAYGVMTINADGAYSYVLNNASAAVQGLKVGQVVADAFSYTVSDGQGGSATTSITVSITGKNDTPVAVIDTNAVFAASPVAASGNVLANDTDVDGDTLTVNQVKGLATNVGVPVAGTYGTLTINANGSYTYMLNPASAALIALGPNQTATDTFAYRAGDGAANATSSLVITVTGQNEGPVVTAETRTITEDPTTATLTGNVLTNDRDPDGGVLAVQAVNGGPGNVGVAVTSAYGVMTINADGAYSYVLNNASAAVQGLKVGQVVADAFSYTVSDGQGGSATTSITVSITGKNDGPTATATLVSVSEDGVLSASGSVLATAVDPDGDALTVTQVRGVAANVGVQLTGTYGFLTINANGAYAYALNNGAANVQALTQGQTVTDTFSYRLADPSGAVVTTNLIVTVTGAAENRAPVAALDTVSTPEDSPVTFDPRLNDTDADGDALTITMIGGQPVTSGQSVSVTGGVITLNANGALTFTPAANFNGPVSVAYTISDTHGATSSANINVGVTSVNDAPVVSAQGLALFGGAAPAELGIVAPTDTDGDTLQVTVTLLPQGGQLRYGAADGGGSVALGAVLTVAQLQALMFAPDAGGGLVTSFHYSVSDGHGGVTQATFGIYIAAPEDQYVEGFNSDDRVFGSALSDFIIGFGGNDTIYGGDGDDNIQGDGSATYNGPSGNDTIFGGAGDDLMRGGAGVDSFDGGLGFDRVSFYSVYATQGVVANLLTQTISNDGYGNAETMVSIEGLGAGTAFSDTLIGDDNDNTILGDSGDVLIAGGGNDEIYLGGAPAIIDGGAGIDSITVQQGGHLVPDTNGDGAAEVINASAGVVIDLEAGTIADGFGVSGVISGIENVTGSRFGDTITGDGGANVILGDDGNDVLRGRGGGDLLEGGLGNDQLYGEDGDDVLVVGARTLVDLTGEVYNGGAGIDTLRVDTGVLIPDGLYRTTFYNSNISSIERLEFGATSVGENQAGVLWFQLGGGLSKSATIAGSANTDSVIILAFGTGTYSIADTNFTLENWSDTGEYGTSDHIIFVGAGGAGAAYTLIGSNGNETILGADLSDSLSGGAGNDVLVGYGGVDTFSGGAGDDFVIVGSYNPMVSENYALETYDGGDGVDTFGTVGFTNLAGQNIVLTSFEGLGSFGTNTFHAGPPSYSSPPLLGSHLTVDQALLSQLPSSARISGSAVTVTTSGQVLSQQDVITILMSPGTPVDMSSWTFRAWDPEDYLEVIGSTGGDTITGSSQSDHLDGRDGNDLIHGGAGNDVITGGFGIDQMFGEDGDDTLVVGPSTLAAQSGEVIDGGAGVDTLVVDAGVAQPGSLSVTNFIGTALSSIEKLSFGATAAGRDNQAVFLFTQLGAGLSKSAVFSGSANRDTVVIVVAAPAFSLADTAFTFENWTVASDYPSSDHLILIGVAGPPFGYTLTGSSGSEVIVGAGLNDTLIGGGGGDILVGNGGVDVFRGGDGDDALVIGSQVPGYTENYGLETYDGGDGNDIFGANGVYVDISGMGIVLTSIEAIGVFGTSTYFAGPPSYVDLPTLGGHLIIDQAILAQLPAALRVQGSSGANTPPGFAQQDILTVRMAVGVPVDMSLWTFSNWENQDHVQVIGTANADTITGSSQNDWLDGGADNDVLRGGAGSDELIGGLGNDQLFGGDGDDTLIVGGRTIQNLFGEIYDGGAGIDTLRVDTGILGPDNAYNTGFYNSQLNSIERLEFGDTAIGENQAGVLWYQLGGGLSKDAVISGSANRDTFLIVAFGSGTFSIADTHFTYENWTLSPDYGVSDATVFVGVRGQGFSYTLVGSDGGETLYGAEGADTLIGGGGNDVLVGNAGVDVFSGGDGDDFIVIGSYDPSSSENYALETYDGGAGIDTIGAVGFTDLSGQGIVLTSIEGLGVLGTLTYNPGPTPYSAPPVLGSNLVVDQAILAQLPANLRITGASHALTPTGELLSQTDILTILMSPGAPVDMSAWTFASWDYEDYIEVIGTGSADTVTGSIFADDIQGRGGDDVLDAGAGDDGIDGGEGNDTIHGGDGNDFLAGGNGVDTLYGGDGNDVINLQPDNNVATGVGEFAYGGDGNDLFRNTTGGDLLDGGAGVDRVSYFNIGGAITVDLNIQGVAQDTGAGGMDTFVSIENISGTAFDDTIIGNNEANQLNGNNGADTLEGHGGDDLLIGDANAISNDTMDGGDGSDTVSYFQFETRTQGVNIDLAAGTAGSLGGGETDTLISIENATGTALGDTITGSAGANILKGMGGADILFGGLGADSFRYDAASDGGDTIGDFQPGVDTIYVSASGFGGGLTAGASVMLTTGADPLAVGGQGQFLFDTDDSTLLWDADGDGAGAAVLLARLAGVGVLGQDAIVVGQ